MTEARILDIASGGGDLVIALAKYGANSGFRLHVEGCDVSNTAIRHARESADAARVRRVQFFSHDAVRDPLPGAFDFVTCTLFLHHTTNEQAVALLHRMKEAAQSALLVDDLLRSRTGLLLAHTACRVLTRSPVVHADGPASVRNAFSRGEAERLATAAGLTGFASALTGRSDLC